MKPMSLSSSATAATRTCSRGYKLRFKSAVATVDLTMREVQYTNDALARLLTANDGTTNYTYGYDTSGNLTNNNGVTRVYNGANQMTQNGATALTYFSNGNLQNDGTTTYVWDRANRLRTAGNTQYRYDGDGNRISQIISGVITKYVFDVQPGLAQVLSETTNSVTTRYTHSPRGIHSTRIGTGGWEYYLQDGLSSVRSRVNANATVLQSVNYSPIGAPDVSITGFAFTGEQRDSIEVQYHRARYYYPNLATWMSQDLLETQNRYAYVNGNPINFVDRSGLRTDDELIRIVEELRDYICSPYGPCEEPQGHIYDEYDAFNYPPCIEDLSNVCQTLCGGKLLQDVLGLEHFDKGLLRRWIEFATDPLMLDEVERENHRFTYDRIQQLLRDNFKNLNDNKCKSESEPLVKVVETAKEWEEKLLPEALTYEDLVPQRRSVSPGVIIVGGAIIATCLIFAPQFTIPALAGAGASAIVIP
jgi:RHS repeat-associated protein